MRVLIALAFFVASPAMAFDSCEFDRIADEAIEQTEISTDEKFNIEEYKEELRTVLAEGRKKFEQEYAEEIKALSRAMTRLPN